MEKELVNGSSILETSFFHLKPWEKGAKAIDRFVWVSILGLPLIGWNHRCIESIIEKAGKMLGYDITSVSQGSLTGVKVLLSTTSFETLNEHVLLVLDGDEFEISIMEMKPDFSPLLSTIKHSMGATGIQTLDEELCSEFAASNEVTTTTTKITDTDGDHCATDITLTQQQKADTNSDFSLILYQGESFNEGPGVPKGLGRLSVTGRMEGCLKVFRRGRVRICELEVFAAVLPVCAEAQASSSSSWVLQQGQEDGGGVAPNGPTLLREVEDGQICGDRQVYVDEWRGSSSVFSKREDQRKRGAMALVGEKERPRDGWGG
ncbi:hypothetical protein POTOM_058011 [Populus tomentosa]|uniref:DUF4283 domain-containing protein n=1 Tax=Populus tomentosa TaxID=118781 RepID=A0A8X8C2I7_POPTO|nr:hypothetical protein POTOM_058011 [Populus tomentosa]